MSDIGDQIEAGVYQYYPDHRVGQGSVSGTNVDPTVVAPPELVLEPYGDRILVRPDTKGAVSAGGIILLDEEKLARGTVLAVGPGAWRGEHLEPMPWNAGDWLLYGKYAGQKVTLNDEELVVLRMDDVIGELFEAV